MKTNKSIIGHCSTPSNKNKSAGDLLSEVTDERTIGKNAVTGPPVSGGGTAENFAQKLARGFDQSVAQSIQETISRGLEENLKKRKEQKQPPKKDFTDAHNLKPLRERLVLAGIEEICQYGVRNFSVRRIARKCSVSCAAPYKHFKDKQAFYAAIIEYIQQLWRDRQEQVIVQNGPNIRKQLVAVSLEYISFLVENPHFRSIIMMKEDHFDPGYKEIKSHISDRSRELIQQYCHQVNMPEKTALVKMYIVRSLIYGASLMFDNGELPYTPEIFRLVEQVIDREFDLP